MKVSLPSVSKTSLLLIFALLLFIAVIVQLLANQRLVVALTLLVVLGIFAWCYDIMSRQWRRKIVELGERRANKTRGPDEPPSAHDAFFATNASRKEIMRTHSEQRPEEETMLSDLIINCLPGIFYFYDRDGNFLRWNKNFEAVSGYTDEEISAMHPLNFFQGDDQLLLKDRISEVFSKGHADVTADFYTKDNRRIPYYFNGRKVNLKGIDYLIGMGLDVTDRVNAENALLERNEEIEKLSAHLENVREEERSRIALEIHDVLGQQLTALKMDSNWLKKRSQDDASAQRISSMLALIDETIKTVRKISSELRPAILDDLGLIAAVEWQGSEFEKNTGIHFQFESNATDLELERNFSTNLFRVFQETLTNIARHAKATKVHVVFAHRGEFIQFTVKDNGVGFDLNEVRKKRSLGLVGMNERARKYGGRVNIENNVPHGTIVNMTIPLPTSTKAL